MDRIIFTSMVATVVVIAAVGWMYLIPNSHVFTVSSARSKEADNNTNFLKEMENAPKDRYPKSYITINGFELTADLALTNEQKEKGLSVKDELKENEAMLFIFEDSQNIHFG